MKNLNHLEQTIYDVVKPICDKQELILFSVEEVKEDGLKIIRVLVDADHTVDLEEVTKVIEPLQEVVEKDDLIPDEYYLEVSSVGVEKPLRNIDELQSSTNKYIYVELKSIIENDSAWYGTLVNVENNIVSLEINKKGRIKTIKFPYEEIKFARIAIKF